MSLPRRALLLGAAAALSSARAAAHAAAGRVDPPQAPPALNMVLEDGAETSLAGFLKDRVTALQLMFTSCQATCPIQGALFAETAKKLADGSKPAQLLSLSIDPDHDTPAALRQWQKRFGPSPRWRAAQPQKAQLEALITFLKSKTPGPDPHSAQAYLFDRKGRLVLRSVDFPPATEIVRMLAQLVAQAAK